MVVKRIWRKRIWNKRMCHYDEKCYCGWFLFGIIPLYIKQL